MRSCFRPGFFLAHPYRPLVPQTPQNTSNPSITRDEQYILNDTSLAALVLSNGDQQLFFQDNTGLVRSAIRTTTDNQWSIGPNISVSPNAKKYTRLAIDSKSGNTYSSVLIQTLNNTWFLYQLTFIQVFLYYVSESHVLHSSPIAGIWDGQDPQQNYTTAENARSLCIASIANATTGSESSAYFFYENSTGSVSALLRRQSTSGFPRSGFQYVDVTNQCKALSHDFCSGFISDSHTVYNLGLSVPFTCPTTWNSTDIIGPLFTSLLIPQRR